MDLTGSQPDGIALADDGALLVGCYRPDRLYGSPPAGSPRSWRRIPTVSSSTSPANVAFVGPDLDRIVVSSLGGWSLMIAETGTAGAAPYYPVLP